jgi:hypothetical protein
MKITYLVQIYCRPTRPRHGNLQISLKILRPEGRSGSSLMLSPQKPCFVTRARLSAAAEAVTSAK